MENAGTKALIRAAPLLMVLAMLAIILVGAAHGWHALVISLILALPVAAMLLHGYSKTRREEW